MDELTENVPASSRADRDLLVVGISLNAAPLMSYSKSRHSPIAPRAPVDDPDRSVDSPMRVATLPALSTAADG